MYLISLSATWLKDIRDNKHGYTHQHPQHKNTRHEVKKILFKMFFLMLTKCHEFTFPWVGSPTCTRLVIYYVSLLMLRGTWMAGRAGIHHNVPKTTSLVNDQVIWVRNEQLLRLNTNSLLAIAINCLFSMDK